MLRLAAAQLGPTQRADPRPRTLGRLIALLERAAADGAELVVFPELALTTFFPRWAMADDDPELLGCFEAAMPNPAVQPLFDRAGALGVGFHLGYAELTPDGTRYNSAILVGPAGEVLGRYRKVHLPGTRAPQAGQTFQQLEKRYFAPGDLGFPTFRGPANWGRPVLGMLICNDRRWPEAWRMLGLQGVELVLCGYNSAAYDPYARAAEDAALRSFHSTLLAQANAYMNACWACCVAKAGEEDGAGLIGGSCIVAPDGRVVAQAATLADEVVAAAIDLDACQPARRGMFDFAAHRRPDQYRAIAEQAGMRPPP